MHRAEIKRAEYARGRGGIMNRRTCGAKTKADGHPCGAAAMNGQTRCRYHGGQTPSHLAAAQRRLAEQKAAKIVMGMDLEPVTDPLQPCKNWPPRRWR